MRRPIKIDNSIKKRFSREKKNRNVETRSLRLYFLIICEGEQTEPNYFHQLKKSLPIGSVDIRMEIEGAARNTTSLVEFAKRYRDKSLKQYDRTWVVFDRDSFTDNNFNDAIQNATNNEMKVAWSNEAFELWFLLHFEYISTHMSRQDYRSFLEKRISEKMGKKYKYKKNDPDTHKLINKYGSEELAIKYAKNLEKEHTCTRYATHNPCTKIYQLIEELRNPEIVWKSINSKL